LIIGQKILRANDAVGANQKIGRKRNPIKLMALRNIRIKDAELLDNDTALIRQTRVAEMLRIGEAAQDVLRVVGDDRDVDAVFLESFA
jgi:hypothetical protein